MAIPINLNSIYKKLSDLKTRDRQISYLSEYLFSFQKKRNEMACDQTRLSHLKEKTSQDFKKYHDEFDRGGLIYFNDDESDSKSYKRIGFENLPLLKERLHLENTFIQLESDILLFKDLIKKIKNNVEIQTTPAKIFSLKSNFSKKQIEKLYELLNPEYLQTDLPTFETIFADEIKQFIKPMQWKKSNRLLAYFFDLIMDFDEWQNVIEKCNLFKNKNGKKVTASDLATALNHIRNVDKPKGHKEIDSIISELKKV